MSSIPTRLLPLGVDLIPYDSLVDYVEATGAQYVDTGIVQSSGYFATDLTATITSGPSRYYMFFGTANGSGSSDRLILYNDLQKYVRFNLYRGGSYSIAHQNYPTFSISKTRYDISSSRLVWIFGASSYRDNNGSCRLRTFKLWDANGVLVRDYQPVRVGTAGAIYDLVEKRLYCSATATPLLPGNDI